ncbi:valine--tRNA ligase [Hyphomicrobiales bacterium 4NK60-0047b]
MLEKTYQPQDIEERIYSSWEDSGAFAAGADENKKGAEDNFCIVIPPPNVTGSLHMGHALNNSLQDVLIRFERMRGKNVLWQAGTDHAGIATQMVVERQLAEKGLPGRRDLGREKFLEKVWEWKEESGGTIVNQLRRLGSSCDWSRERFTMDEGLSKAVLKVFVDLYNQGLIYKDKRLVNWDPKLLTAISDLEVEARETNGHMWHFKYPIEGTDQFIVVATTRPETMLGDTGVAVHPDDERYKDLVGKQVRLPISDRLIPIVADEYPDPEQGSGAVKMTPAHDFNDFEVGKRQNLEMINIFDQTAHLNENVPEEYQGMERFSARKKVVAEMEALGLLEKIDDHELTVPYGDRSEVVIEPWLTDQWYVNAEVLAKPAIEAVMSGKTKFVPANWDKTYYEWMNNIQPWCISRQLWWGHQIPAWYGPDGEVFVAQSEAEAQALADKHYGEVKELTRDEDVLDTWFSSALWPFSTLGWPEKTPELARYYPTATLSTAFDIIFFWVARMMMMGIHFMDEVPFDTVYIHALVRDEKGKKMSKSKGNVVDPLGLIDEYGADALRFTMAAMAAPGRDVAMSIPRVEGYRNFATKLWNAARFAEMNECVGERPIDVKSLDLTVNRWIVGEVELASKEITTAIENYRFNDAASSIYQFIWNTYCDWYVELSKPIFSSGSEAEIEETQAVTAWVMDEMMKLLHPFMPFMTEELWQRLGEHGRSRDTMLINAEWPTYDGSVDEAASQEISWLIKLISDIRSARSEMNVPAGAKMPLVMVSANEKTTEWTNRHENTIKHMARLEDISFGAEVPEGSVQVVMGEAIAALSLKGVIDVEAEVTRLNKELGKVSGEIKKLSGKLSNEQFLSKAPEDVIVEQKRRLAEETETKDQLEAALERMKELG